MKKQVVFFVLSLLIGLHFISCNKINHFSNQGLYRYLYKECKSEYNQDTLYTSVIISSSTVSDSLKMVSDLIGNIIGTKNAILQLLSIEYADSVKIHKTYALFSIHQKKDEVLSIKIKETNNSFLIRCLSTDTIIQTNSGKFSDIIYIENTEEKDVGNLQIITDYGFSKDGKIVYMKVTDILNTKISACYELSLIDFKLEKSNSQSIYDNWLSRNSDKLKTKILGIYNDSLLNKMPPPPK